MKKRDYIFLFILIICILLVPSVANAARKCSSLLGSTTPVGGEYQPAYYVNLAFQALKYICIVLLLGFSVVDFVKALTAEDPAALKNASKKSGRRVIYLILLFFLPTLVFMIFGWLGIVDGNDCVKVVAGS